MEPIITRYISEASGNFEDKLNELIREMSYQGYNFKGLIPFDTHSSNRVAAVVIFEEK